MDRDDRTQMQLEESDYARGVLANLQTPKGKTAIVQGADFGKSK